MRRAVALLGCLLGCAGPAGSGGPAGPGKLPPEALDPSWVAEAGARLSGTSARCSGGVCACRPIDDYGLGQAATDGEDPGPAPGTKRFELRTGRGADTARITIEGVGTFEKTGPDPQPGCIYLDLAPGAHRVRYHVTASDPAQGVEPVLRISEYSPTFRRWYRTFAFGCRGNGGPCSYPDARDAVQRLGQVAGGKHDRCGSTRVQGLRYQSARPADVSMSDFDLQLVLNVYRFDPRFEPGAKRCAGTSYDAETVQEGR